MIVVKVELWPFGSEHRAREIGRMYIANDGAGTRERGDYKVAACRRGSTEVPREVYPASLDGIREEKRREIEAAPRAARAGEVKDYPRLSYNVWRLIARAALAAFPEEDANPPKRRARAVLDRLVARGLHVLAEPLRVALSTPNHFQLPPGDLGDAMRAALEWLDAAAGGPRHEVPGAGVA